MFIGLFGVPSVLTSLGVHTLRLLLSKVFGEHDIIYPSSLEDLKEAWTRRAHNHIVCFNELPHSELISFLTEANAPFIVFLNSTFAVAEGLIAERGLQPLDAVRTASISMSVLESAVTVPRSLIIRSDNQTRNNLREVLSKLTAFLDIRLSAFEINALLEQILPAGFLSQDLAFEDLHDHALSVWAPSRTLHSAHTKEMSPYKRCLSGYDSILEGRPVEHLVWEGPLFMQMDNPDIITDSYVDITGPARILVYGPYLGAPIGRWRATIDISVKDNISGNQLLVEVLTTEILNLGHCELPPQGDFAVDIEFDVPESRHGLVIRLGSQKGAIEGAIRLKRVSLTRKALGKTLVSLGATQRA